MASISTLIDPLDDDSIDATKWSTYTVGTGSIVEANGNLEATVSTAGDEAQISSVNSYDLTGSQATIKIIDAVGASSDFYPGFRIQIDDNNRVRWEVSYGYIKVFVRVAGSETRPWLTEYDADIYRYLKIRELSGTTYFDYSANGLDWTNAYSVANPFNVTSIKARITNSSDASATYTAKWKYFNVLPSSYSGQLMMV